MRGGSCPRARPGAPRVRVVSVRGHRPLLSTVQTTPCASRGAGRRVLAAWRWRCGRPAAPPGGRRARPRATTTRITPRTRQRSIEFSYPVFTKKTRTALQVNRTVQSLAPRRLGSLERETRSRPTRAHASGVNMPPWPLPEQVDVRIVPEARTHEAAYASEQQPHRRAPPTGCAHPVASKQRPSRTPWASDHGSGTPDDASRRSRTAGAAPASHLRADNRATAEAAEARRGTVPMQG